MDKFLIDPPDDITIENVIVPKEYNMADIPTGPPPTPIQEKEPLIERPEPLSVENISVPEETGPPASVIKDSIEPIRDSSLTGETLLPIQNAVVEEPVKFSWTRWILWILVLVLFIVLSLYYSIKYALYRSGYLIKKNAKGYKISLEELKTDIQDWLTKWVEGIRDWNENLTGKTNQFFFRQHVDKGTFKATKYKIPKNLIPNAGADATAP
jgi:hypothetical protein